MSSRPRRATISLALVGTGDLWESRVKPAIHEFRDRVKIVGVFDEVRSRSVAIAADFKAESIPSLTILAERPDIDGVIVCDSGWAKSAIIELLTLHGKHCLVFDWEKLADTDLQRISDLAGDVGTTLMVDFEVRFRPVLRRLRELSATELGPAQQIEVFLPSFFSLPETHHEILARRELIEWLDVSQVLFGRTPHALVARHNRGDSAGLAFPEALNLEEIPVSQTPPWWPWWGNEGSRLSAKFRSVGTPSSKGDSDAQEAAGKSMTPLSLVFQRGSISSSEDKMSGEIQRADVKARLIFAHGVAQVISTTELSWTPHGGALLREDLGSERPADVLMLDQFIRRTIGGLLPVPELSQIQRYRQLLRNLMWESAEQPSTDV